MNRNVKGLFLVWMLLGLFALGCGGDGSTLGSDGSPQADAPDGGDDGDGGDDDGSDNGPPTVNLAQLSAEIFTPNCAVSGCHAGGAAAAGMNLAADVIAGNIIGVDANNYPGKRIDLDNPDDSVILKKLRGDDSVGTQMPPTGSLLSADQITMIADWIAAGAPTE